MNKIIVSVGIILYFFSSHVYIMESFNENHKLILTTGILLILLSLKKNKISKKLKVLDIIYLIFLISILCSYIVNREKEIFISFLGIGILGLIFNIYLTLNIKLYKYLLKNLENLILSPCIVLLLYSIIKYPIVLSRYRGFFYTSNGMGGTASFCFTLTLAILLDKILKTKLELKKIFYYILIFCFSFFLTLISTSRSAIITNIILLILSIFLLVKNLVVSKKFFRIIIIGVFFSIMIICGYYFGQEIINNVILKFIKKASDPFDNRLIFWKEILKNIKLFGNGKENLSWSAHNTFFSILIHYGVIACISWILYCIFYLYESIKLLCEKNKEKIRYIPLFSIINFILLSITEGMMLKSIMLLFVFFVPFIREYKKEFK